VLGIEVILAVLGVAVLYVGGMTTEVVMVEDSDETSEAGVVGKTEVVVATSGIEVGVVAGTE